MTDIGSDVTDAWVGFSTAGAGAGSDISAASVLTGIPDTDIVSAGVPTGVTDGVRPDITGAGAGSDVITTGVKTGVPDTDIVSAGVPTGVTDGVRPDITGAGAGSDVITTGVKTGVPDTDIVSAGVPTGATDRVGSDVTAASVTTSSTDADVTGVTDGVGSDVTFTSAGSDVTTASITIGVPDADVTSSALEHDVGSGASHVGGQHTCVHVINVRARLLHSGDELLQVRFAIAHALQVILHHFTCDAKRVEFVTLVPDTFEFWRRRYPSLRFGGVPRTALGVTQRDLRHVTMAFLHVTQRRRARFT